MIYLNMGPLSWVLVAIPATMDAVDSIKAMTSRDTRPWSSNGNSGKGAIMSVRELNGLLVSGRSQSFSLLERL